MGLKEKSLLAGFLLVWFSLDGYAQDYTSFYQESLEHNKNGMYALGTWAVGNMISGGIGWSRQTGNTKYFHQMNFFWNTVNLGIAGFAYVNAVQTDVTALSATEMISKHRTFENILLINAGLDIGYMGLGYYLRNLSESKDKNKELLAGYGNSIMLQGAFLFGFDLILYAIQRNHRITFLNAINTDLSFYPTGIEMVFRF